VASLRENTGEVLCECAAESRRRIN
jgi:hypothetical protein